MSGWTGALLLAKFGVYTGWLALAGSLLVGWLAPSMRRASGYYLLLASMFGLVSAIAYFPVQVGSFAESGIEGMLDPDMIRLLWQTSAGALVKTRVAGSLLAMVAACVLIGARRWSWANALVFAGLSLVVQGYGFTLSGHIAAEGATARWVLAIHIAAAGLWIGALPLLWWTVRRSQRPEAAQVLHEFGRAIGVSLVLLFACGFYLFWRLAGDLPSSLAAPWSLVLLSKLLLVSGLLTVAVLNRWRLVPAFRHGGSARQLDAALIFDLGLAAGVLILTAFLSTAVGPPGH